MKKPEVPCRCGVVSRNSGRRRMGEPRPLGAERLGLEARRRRRPPRSRRRSACRRSRRSCRPAACAPRRPRAARAGAPGAGGARQRRSGRRREHAEPGAGRVDERPVEAALGELAHVGVDDARRCVARAAGRSPRARARGPGGARRRSPAPREHRRLAAGRGAGVEDALAVARAERERGELRAAALGQIRAAPRAPPGRAARRR